MGISAAQERYREELRDYRESQKDFWDLNSVIETAENKGRAEGRAEERDFWIKKLYEKGMSEEEIKEFLK